MTDRKLKPQEKPHYVNNKEVSLAVVDYCEKAEKAKKQKSKKCQSYLTTLQNVF